MLFGALLSIGSATALEVYSRNGQFISGSEGVVRVDRVNGPFSYEFKKVVLPAEFIPISQGLLAKNALAPEQAFEINLKCDPTVSAALCAKVKSGLQNAGARIAGTFLINKPIVVSCDFKPFCQNVAGNCPLANVLGGAQYSSAFAVVNGDMTFMYPQALLKQLNSDRILPFGPSDITASFNSEYNFHFSDDGIAIAANQVDFEYVAGHELLHGMGFGTGLLEYSTVFPGSSPGYLAPIVAGAADEAANDSTLFSRMTPVDIYDNYIFGTSGTSFRDLAKSILVFPDQSKNISLFVSSFESSGGPFKAARRAYLEATSGLVFKTKSGQSVNLYSPTRYAQGSSISHVPLTSSNTPDFLMIPAVGPGKTVADVMNALNVKTPYGPSIVAIMETIGWATPQNPTVQSVQIDTANTKPTGSSVRMSATILFLPLVAYLL